MSLGPEQTLENPIVANSRKEAANILNARAMVEEANNNPFVITYIDRHGNGYVFENLKVTREWLRRQIYAQIDRTTESIEDGHLLPTELFLPGINIDADNGVRDDMRFLLYVYFRRIEQDEEEDAETPEELKDYLETISTKLLSLYEAITNIPDENEYFRNKYLLYLQILITEALPIKDSDFFEQRGIQDIPKELQTLYKIGDELEHTPPPQRTYHKHQHKPNTYRLFQGVIRRDDLDELPTIS